MAMYDQPAWTILQCERCATGLMHRAHASPPVAGALGFAQGAGDLLGSAHAALDRNSASAACHCGERCLAVLSALSPLWFSPIASRPWRGPRVRLSASRNRLN